MSTVIQYEAKYITKSDEYRVKEVSREDDGSINSIEYIEQPFEVEAKLDSISDIYFDQDYKVPFFNYINYRRTESGDAVYFDTDYVEISIYADPSIIYDRRFVFHEKITLAASRLKTLDEAVEDLKDYLINASLSVSKTGMRGGRVEYYVSTKEVAQEKISSSNKLSNERMSSTISTGFMNRFLNFHCQKPSNSSIREYQRLVVKDNIIFMNTDVYAVDESSDNTILIKIRSECMDFEKFVSMLDGVLSISSELQEFEHLRDLALHDLKNRSVEFRKTYKFGVRRFIG